LTSFTTRLSYHSRRISRYYFLTAAGIDSVFVLGGIHAEELGLVPTGISDCGIVITDGDDDKQEAGHIAKQDLNKKLQLFFKEKGICPTHVIPSLTL